MSEIYCLYSTEDGEPRYVGQAEEGTQRCLKQHRTQALEMAQGDLYDWIRDLYRRGFEVEAHVLQTNITPSELEFYEKYWMDQFSGLHNVRDSGASPTQTTDIGRKIIVGLKARLAAQGVQSTRD